MSKTNVSECAVINVTAIQKRIEELEEEYKSEPAYQFNTYGDKLIKEIMILKQILSQSTPLIPIVEKAWDASIDFNKPAGLDSGINLRDFISNLKLDI